MAITIVNFDTSTIRIHDEMCDPVIKDCLERLNTIVYKSYMRRLLIPEAQGNVETKT